jgi:LCP family protein required for cell wall assembly
MKKWMKLVLCFLIILMLISASAVAVVYLELSKIKVHDPVYVVPPEEEYFEIDEYDSGAETDGENVKQLEPEEVEWPDGIEQISGLDTVNVLLIGQDKREGQKRQRSDSMIIVSYNTNDGTVKMISLMRDLYVQIPGYSDNRLNVAYVFGGMKLLEETIKRNFGVQVDGNFEVDFDGFKKVIDILGGVDITLSKEEAKHLNKKYGWKLAEGDNHLTGEQALEYSRIRYVGRDDFERTERQRTVLTKVINEILELDTAKKLKVLDEVFPYLTTDMSKTDILSYAYTILQNGVNGIENYRIPGDNAFKQARIRGMAVLVPNLKKNRALIEEYLS